MRIRGPFLFIAAVALFASAKAEDLIVESGNGGQNHDHYSEAGGDWKDSDKGAGEKSTAAGLAAGACAARKIELPASSPAEARFYPRFSGPCHACVYLTWPKASNAKNVIFWAVRGGSPISRRGSQNGNGFKSPSTANMWVYIGEYDFTGGPDEYVGVRVKPGDTQQNDGSSAGFAFADAARFSTNPLTSADGATMFAYDQANLSHNSGPNPKQSPVPSGLAAVAGIPATNSTAIDAGANKNHPSVSKTTANVGNTIQLPGTGTQSQYWQTEIQEAMSIAANTHKRILLYCYAADASRCQKCNKMLSTDAKLMKLISDKYVPLALDMEKVPDTAKALEIYRAGTFLVYDSNSAAIKKLEGDFNAAALISELNY